MILHLAKEGPTIYTAATNTYMTSSKSKFSFVPIHQPDKKQSLAREFQKPSVDIFTTGAFGLKEHVEANKPLNEAVWIRQPSTTDC